MADGMHGLRRAADVMADLYTVCYSLGRKEFDALLGPIEDVWRFEALRKVPVLFALSEQQLFELAHCMKNHSITAGQMVFRQGDPGAHAALLLGAAFSGGFHDVIFGELSYSLSSSLACSGLKERAHCWHGAPSKLQ